MSYWKPHLTRQLPLEIGPQTTAASLSVVPATGATFTTTFGGDTNFGTPGASTMRTAAMLGVGAIAVSNANPVPVSDAGGSLTVDGTVSASNFPATVDTNSGAAGASTLRTVLSTRHEAVATPLAVTLSSGSAAIDYNAGSPSANTPRVEVAKSAATFQSMGSVAGTALTGTYQTVLTLTADAVCLVVLNTCNNTILVSLDGGTSDTLRLESGESLTLDFGTNGRRVSSGATIQAKHAGAAPTQGTIRATRIG